MINKLCTLYLPSNPETEAPPETMLKWRKKECLFRSMVKCCQNANFEEIDIEPSTAKHDGFLLLSGTFKEYIKQNIMTVKKSKFSFIWHLKIDKKAIM